MQPAPSPPERRADLGPKALLTLLALGWAGYFALRYAYSLYDDAYIYFRFAQNALDGCGLRFNCGDAPVEGFTSPLYLLLLVVGGALGFEGDLETLTQLLGVIGVTGALAVVAVTVGGQAKERWGHAAGWAAGLGAGATLAGAYPLMLTTVIGLETALGALCAAAVVRSALKPELPWLRTWLMVALLIRPEAALWMAAVLVFPRARSVRYLAPLTAAVGAVVVWRWAVFGELFPNTFHAKSGGTPAHWDLGVEYIVITLKDFPWMVLAPLALLHAGWRRPLALVGLSGLVWLGFFLKSGGDTFAYSRLSLPVGVSLTVFGWLGLVAVLERVSAVPAVAAAGLAVVLGLGSGAYGQARYDLPHEQHGFGNVGLWSDVGSWLKATHPQATIAVVPIGAISYVSEVPRVLDLVGLASPEVAKAGRSVPPERLGRHWIGHERHNSEWVVSQRPDLIVFGKGYPQPHADVQQARAGFYAEWLLLRAVKQGQLPYDLYMPQIRPGVFWQILVRRDRPTPPNVFRLSGPPLRPGSPGPP